MALSQSALSELLEAHRTCDGVDMIRESVRTVLQELVEFEAFSVSLAAYGDTAEAERYVHGSSGCAPGCSVDVGVLGPVGGSVEVDEARK
ncbi:MAG TPA: hypothetical protein VFP34_17585 [Microlunatus sp.]|nr:hypothetical protein [Microlunatus sp.]